MTADGPQPFGDELLGVFLIVFLLAPFSLLCVYRIILSAGSQSEYHASRRLKQTGKNNLIKGQE